MSAPSRSANAPGADLSSSPTGAPHAADTAARLWPRLVGLGLLILASAWLSLTMGSFPTSPGAVWQALLTPAQSDIGFIIWQLRLPRIVLALLVGSALGMAGAILQSIVRNPLASPDVIGITSGAALAAVCCLTLFGTTLSIHWLPLAAMGGALLAALLIVGLAWRGGIKPARIILVGIGLAAALGAATTLLIVMSDDSAAMSAYVWLTGSLYAAQWPSVTGLLPWLLIALPVSLAFSRHADALALGDGVAEGLGVALVTSRLVLLGCSVMLAGAAVAVAGGIGFVGLIAPHLAARLSGRQLARLLPTAALIGALIVLYADLLGRVAFLPKDLPAGVFIAGIGAPFFVYLLHRTR